MQFSNRDNLPDARERKKSNISAQFGISSTCCKINIKTAFFLKYYCNDNNVCDLQFQFWKKGQIFAT
jgi:hypothetical protein